MHLEAVLRRYLGQSARCAVDTNTFFKRCPLAVPYCSLCKDMARVPSTCKQVLLEKPDPRRKEVGTRVISCRPHTPASVGLGPLCPDSLPSLAVNKPCLRGPWPQFLESGENRNEYRPSVYPCARHIADKTAHLVLSAVPCRMDYCAVSPILETQTK